MRRSPDSRQRLQAGDPHAALPSVEVIIRFLTLPPEEEAFCTRRLLRLFASSCRRQTREEPQGREATISSSGKSAAAD